MSASSLSEYKEVLRFLVKFIGLYLLLNVAYGFFIEFYDPQSDPVTQIVSGNVVHLLQLGEDSISMKISVDSPYIGILRNGSVVIRAFEGCNGINVMIVFVSFLFAFEGSLKRTLYFGVFGIVVIYVLNLLRVIALFEVAMHIPSKLYFFHKYFFTAVLYLVVFTLWYFWVKQVKRSESGTPTS